jgi:Ca2+-binding RTX toxin-like protein
MATPVTTGRYGVLNGGAGDDTLTSLDISDPTLNGGGGDDDIIFKPNGDNQIDYGVVNGGTGDDYIRTFGGDGGGRINGDGGDDFIYVQGTVSSVDGGAGDDTIVRETRLDASGTSYLKGGAGDDLIVFGHTEGYQIHASVEGNSGDDTILAMTYISDSEYPSYHELSGGEGSDRFELDFSDIGANADGLDKDAGVVTTITDFKPGEDVLVLPINIELDNRDGFEAPVTFIITQANDESYTDVVFSLEVPAASADAESATFTATVRLTGAIGLSASDVLLAELQSSDIQLPLR